MTSTAHDDKTAAALKFDCPFCKAPIGEACRTRNSGREQDWPHMRRRALTTPVEHRYQPTDLGALCCACGHQRTVSSNYTARWNSDPNYHYGEEGKAAGWRRTQSLKCVECGQRTRHAVLPAADRSIDYDERYQRYILGGDWLGQYPPDRDSARGDYFAKFPRNPNLHHRFYIDAATKAWDEGHKTVTALCGAPDTIKNDPRTWSTGTTKKNRNEHDGYVVAEVLGDTEYEDPETGLSWVDMDCVDCCRVANDRHLANRRKRLEYLLSWLATRPERINDAEVECCVDLLERLARAVDDRHS